MKGIGIEGEKVVLLLFNKNNHSINIVFTDLLFNLLFKSIQFSEYGMIEMSLKSQMFTCFCHFFE
jgi:hypothetical protein